MACGSRPRWTAACRPQMRPRARTMLEYDRRHGYHRSIARLRGPRCRRCSGDCRGRCAFPDQGGLVIGLVEATRDQGATVLLRDGNRVELTAGTTCPGRRHCPTIAWVLRRSRRDVVAAGDVIYLEPRPTGATGSPVAGGRRARNPRSAHRRDRRARRRLRFRREQTATARCRRSASRTPRSSRSFIPPRWV